MPHDLNKCLRIVLKAGTSLLNAGWFEIRVDISHPIPYDPLTYEIVRNVLLNQGASWTPLPVAQLISRWFDEFKILFSYRSLVLTDFGSDLAVFSLRCIPLRNTGRCYCTISFETWYFLTSRVHRISRSCFVRRFRSKISTQQIGYMYVSMSVLLGLTVILTVIMHIFITYFLIKLWACHCAPRRSNK